MKIIFFGNENFALKCDGLFLGNFAQAEIDDFYPCFVEASPHGGSSSVSGFFSFPPNPISGADVFCLKDGYAVRFNFTNAPREDFSLILQERPLGQNGPLLTAYRDGKTHVVLEDDSFVETATLPFNTAKLKYSLHGDNLVVCTETSPSHLTVFSTSPIKLLFSNFADEFSFTPLFRTKTTLFNLEMTTVECEWEEKNGALSSTIISSTNGRSFPRPTNTLLCRLLLERVLYKLPTEQLLAESMRENATLLRDFLGPYDCILPDFCTKKGVCIAYPANGRRQTKCFEIEQSDGLITNLIEA